MKPHESWMCQAAAGAALLYLGYRLGSSSSAWGNAIQGKDVPDFAGKSFKKGAKENAALEVRKNSNVTEISCTTR